jgi:hypothetical protein
MLPRFRRPVPDEVIGGGVAALIGLAIMLVGLFDNREDAFPAGRLPVFLAGAAFSAAGASILLEALWKGQRGFRIASAFGVLCGLIMLAVPLSFIVKAGAVWNLVWALVLGFSLVGAAALVLSKLRSPWPSKRARFFAAALLVLLAAAAGFRLFRHEPAAPAAQSERPRAEQEPPDAGR